MSLLELNTVDLRQKIEAELANNPALEFIEECHCPECGRLMNARGFCPACSRLSAPASEDPIVFLSTLEDFYPHDLSVSGEEEESEDPFGSQEEDLPFFVLRQIATELAVPEREIAVHILTALDEDGLLTIPLAEIARYHYVPLSKVEKIQRLIQRCDPLGVGSSTPQAALITQLEVLGETKAITPLALRAVQEGFDLLSHRRFPDLARLLGTSDAHVREIAQFIGDNLNPYPARAHWGETRGRNKPSARGDKTYYNPDIIISRMTNAENSPLIVEIALPIRGTLRVNPQFRAAVHNAAPEKSEQWRADLEQASLLVKCLQQRNHTIVRLMQRLTAIQRAFILFGDAHLHPLTRASLAIELNLHEATVSRAVADKAVQIPNGHIIPLARFFDRSLHIRTALRKIVNEETLPLSDAELAGLLKKQGFPVARRTVAKYRSVEGILPAHLRTKTSHP
jgi:RNA polymerase sigma-54 factor